MNKAGSFAQKFADRESVEAAIEMEPTVQASANTAGYFLTDHQGASDSPMRGYVYWRSTDTRRQISSLTDKEINRRLDFLYHHYGFCRRLVHGLAKLCGVLTPQPDTADEDWNEEAFDAFMFGAQSPEIFDQAGRFDFFGAQVQWNVSRFRAGRSLAVLTETQSGRASHAFYEAHQIDHDYEGVPTERIRQGVLLSRLTKHIAYFLRDGEEPDKPAKRYDAEDCLYLGKFENHGQTHPLSILAFAVANMVDVVQTRGYWKAAIKSTATRGEVIEQDAQTKFVQGPGGIGTLVPVETENSDGTKQITDRRLIFGGTEIVPLPPGQKLKVVTDDRPTANNLEFERALMQDCVLGTDLPPSAFMMATGQTGPNVRFSMEEIDRWIGLQHLWQARKCHAIYTRAIAKEIKAGRLRQPMKDGKLLEWWRPGSTHWIGLPSMTIDRGRDGRVSVVHLDMGFTTWADEHAAKGAFWKKKLNARVLEVAHVKRKVWEADKQLREDTNGEIGLVYDEVIHRPNSSLLMTSEEESNVSAQPDKS